MTVRRVSVSVAPARAETARAVMLELFPEGFEEVEAESGVELAAYTDARGAERLELAFGTAHSSDVEEGWERRWRDFHRPVRVGPLWVGPPWETPADDTTPVVIDPGRAFGTGAHGTTQLVLELLLELERGSLLDVGCGSGVLAVAAVKLGFAPVTALDSDPAAVEAAVANAARNDVAVDVRLADARVDDLPAAEVVLANISLAAAVELAPRLSSSLVVTSGYLAAEQPVLAGYRHLRRRVRGGWAADLFGMP